jgi:hypothetical protein
MPLTYPAPTGTVAGWEELVPAPGQRLRLFQCFGLLLQTNFDGYEKYSIRALRKKMNVPTTSQLGVPGLRVWLHTVANQEMSAFFFLRANNAAIPPAHVLTVGVTRNDFNIYAALLPLCQWMIGQDPQRLEILSESDPPQNAILAAVLAQIPANKILGKDYISPGDPPWPDNLTRWRLQP